MSDAPRHTATTAVAERAAGSGVRAIGRAPAARRSVAILTPWRPEPADNGAKQRLGMMIEALHDAYDVFLICLLPPGEMIRGPVPSLSGVANEWILPLPVYEPRSPRALVAALRGEPRSLVATWDAALATQVRTIVVRGGMDAVIGFDLRLYRYLLAVADVAATILDEPYVSPFVDLGNGGQLERARARIRRGKYRKTLGAGDASLDRVTCASEDEARAYRALVGRDDVAVYPNAVRTVTVQPWTPTASTMALYTGSITYGPNAEAAEIWRREIYPLVAGHVPGVTLTVTGALPEAIPPPLQHRSLRLTGRLASLDAVYREARVFAAPIRSGTGTRVKLLEAMAAGVPVVSTSKGIEGIEAVSGVHAMIEDEPARFAEATIRIMRDDELAATIGAGGRRLVAERYTWVRSAPVLREVVRSAIADRHGARHAG